MVEKCLLLYNALFHVSGIQYIARWNYTESVSGIQYIARWNYTESVF